MNRKTLMSMCTLVTVLVILVLAAGGYFGYRWITGSSQANAAGLQTATVERGTLTVTVNAAGTITMQSATLAWGTTGVVGVVNVDMGDTVKAGDVLMELDPTSLDYTHIQAKADLLAAQESLEDLLAGPSDLELAQAQLGVAQAEQELEDAEYLWQVQQKGYRASAIEIDKADTDLLLAESDLTHAQTAFYRVAAKPKENRKRVAALNRLIAATEKRDKALRTYNYLTGQPTNITQATLEAQVAVAKAELTEAQETLATLQAGPDPVEVAAAEARVATTQAMMDRARIIAPFDATVVEVQNGVGDYVSESATALVLVDLSQLEVQVEVSELDINSILVGQEAVLTLDAVPGQTFVGRVTNVGYLGSVSQGVVTYFVTVVVDNPDPALKPGMTAAVSIVTNRVEDALLVPNRAIRVNGSQRTVTVLFEGQQIEAPVTLGLSNETMSVVLEGALREGDVVVISSTTTTQSEGWLFGQGGGFRP